MLIVAYLLHRPPFEVYVIIRLQFAFCSAQHHTVLHQDGLIEVVFVGIWHFNGIEGGIPEIVICIWVWPL